MFGCSASSKVSALSMDYGFCLENARGKYVLPIDHDDVLTPDALRVVADAIVDHDFPSVLYTDEDKLDETRFMWPYLKPSWDPVLFVNSCYIAHLGAIDRHLALELGVYTDPAAEGSHDWDTFMRFALAGHRPVHVPEVVYSWRMHAGSTALDIDSKPYVGASQRHVLSRFVASRPHADRYEIVKSPLFGNTPDWWIRRKHVSPRPLLSVALTTTRSDTMPDAMGSYPGHRFLELPLTTPLRELVALLRDEAPPGTLLHLVASDIRMEGEEWPWEALSIFELHPDTAMVGGRVSDAFRANRCGG